MSGGYNFSYIVKGPGCPLSVRCTLRPLMAGGGRTLIRQRHRQPGAQHSQRRPHCARRDSVVAVAAPTAGGHSGHHPRLGRLELPLASRARCGQLPRRRRRESTTRGGPRRRRPRRCTRARPPDKGTWPFLRRLRVREGRRVVCMARVAGLQQVGIQKESMDADAWRQTRGGSAGVARVVTRAWRTQCAGVSPRGRRRGDSGAHAPSQVSHTRVGCLPGPVRSSAHPSHDQR